jgi:biopolymer transport protein ExbB
LAQIHLFVTRNRNNTFFYRAAIFVVKTPASLLSLPLLLLMFAGGVTTAHAADWAHRVKIAIDNTAAGADLKQGTAQFPLAIRLHSGNFTFADARPDGSDIALFAADGKTPLKFHVERFDAANELAVLWVQLPKLTGNAKTDSVTLAWGNAAAPAAGDAAASYDAAQIFVLHFSDSAGVRDATANANHARESTAKPVAAGPLGGAVEFDGAGRIVLPVSASLRIAAAGSFTFTAWVKPAALDGKLFTLGAGAQALNISLAGGTPVATLGKVQVKATATLTAGTWQHLAVTAGGGKLGFYVGGNAAGGGDLVLPEVSGEAVIGEGYRGELEEVTLANAPRDADFIKALAVSQTAESPMLVFDDQAGGDGVSYMGILLGAVTLDGWVVIGILMVMGVISVYVMVAKHIYLTRAKKGNEVFLDVFKNAADDLLTPGKPVAKLAGSQSLLGHSSVYRIYEIGLAEIRHRFDSQSGRGEKNALSAAALDAIRASLDAGLIKENHRLNSQIVLLTIAISGGPFLGLLGTVVGVMITFAAIAAAGDVNVNAIAPGIAAALVATVAGLAVAIPALFGYNWLASQIKNVSADMTVFADEFLTKAAELHSR